MYKKSLLPMIVDSYDSFTSVEKAIADYFLSNNERVDFSSKAMKERLFVSEASLSRFAKKLGFKGYREFIYRYEEGFVEDNEPVSFEFQEVLELYRGLLNETANYVDEEQIKSFCEMLQEAKHVVVFGIGSSGLAAKEMKFRFMRLGVMMEALERSDEMKMQSVMLGKESLAIGISLSGKKEEVVFSLKKAAQGGAKTIMITANQNDDFSYCDQVIVVPSFKGLEAGHIISPQFPVLVMLDVCYYYFYHNVARMSCELHQKTLEVLSEG